jgi:hypothetical protein
MWIMLLVILGVLLLSLIFRKFLKLNFTRLIYGKYSYEYVKLFKKYTRKSPFPYCFKDDILPYLRLSRNKPDVKLFMTDKDLLFESVPFGIDDSQLLVAWKNPDCFNVFRINGVELKAYGYFIMEFDKKTKAVFYFLEDIFVMGEYIIEHVNEGDIARISAQLLQSFDISENRPYNRFFAENKETSVYFYENGFSVIVRFTDKLNKEFQELV